MHRDKKSLGRKEAAVVESCRWLRLSNIYRTGDKAYLIKSEHSCHVRR